MILRNLLIILLFVAGLSVNAQNPIYAYNPYTGSNGLQSPLSMQSPVMFNLQTGATFSSGFGGGSLFNTFMAPSFSKPLGKKFTISAGAVISNTTYTRVNLMDQEGSFRPYSGNTTNMTVYAAGAYQVNDRLTLSGSAYKTINPAFNARLNSDQLRMEAQGVSFGVGYKVGENMHIGAEIRMQQGNSNYYTPFGNPLGNQYGSPFQNGIYGY